MDQSLLAKFLMFVSKTSLMPSVGSNPFVKHEFYEDQGLISRSPKECKMACLALKLKYYCNVLQTIMSNNKILNSKPLSLRDGSQKNTKLCHY